MRPTKKTEKHIKKTRSERIEEQITSIDIEKERIGQVLKLLREARIEAAKIRDSAERDKMMLKIDHKEADLEAEIITSAPSIAIPKSPESPSSLVR